MHEVNNRRAAFVANFASMHLINSLNVVGARENNSDR